MDILLVDDDASLRRTIRTALETMGHRVTEAGDSARALEAAGRHPFPLALLDLRLGSERGIDLLSELLRLAPGMAVVIITAYATVETAVEAMRRGAFSYLPKPFTPDQLRLELERVARARKLQSKVEELEAQVRSAVPEADLQTQEPAMRSALDLALRAADSDATMLLRGESGTGKGVLARAIHAHSRRGGGAGNTTQEGVLPPRRLQRLVRPPPALRRVAPTHRNGGAAGNRPTRTRWCRFVTLPSASRTSTLYGFLAGSAGLTSGGWAVSPGFGLAVSQ